MPRLAPLLALLVLLFPISLSAQFPIAAAEKRPAFGYQRAPAVAASGRDFLAVWEDGRAAKFQPNGAVAQTEFDVYGTRIGLDGAAISDGGVPISPTGAHEGSPVVLWNGSEYVVIHDIRGTMVFTRVLPDRLSERKEVAGSQTADARMDAVWSGDRYLVVRGVPWSVQPRPVKAFLAGADFELAVPEFEVSLGFHPTVASDGSNFLVAWLVDEGDSMASVRVAVISNEGVVSTARTVASFRRNETLPVTAPALTWNGSNYLVVWSDAASIRARHVDRGGNPAAETFKIAPSTSVEVNGPDVAWNGSMYLFSFSYRNELATPTSSPTTNLYAARMSPEGTLIDSPYPLTISTTRWANEDSAVAASGSTFIVIWQSTNDVFAATVDAATGAVGPRQVLARSIWEQSAARGVFDGSNLGLMWEERSGYQSDDPLVLFGRVTPEGHHLDHGGIEIGRGWPGRIAFAGVYFLTWWRQGEFPRGVRISREGVILDSEPVILSTSIGLLATDGRSFIHVGTVGVGTWNDDARKLRTQLIGSSGPASTPKEIVPPAEFDQIPVALAWNGTGYLLLYQQLLGRLDCYRCFPARELRMVTLDRNGEKTSDSVLLQRDANAYVAGARDRFLVATVTAIESENRYIVFSNDGNELESGRLGLKPTDVAWDGTFFNISGFRYASYVLRVDRDGARVSETTLTGVQQPFYLRLISAGGAVALLEQRVEKTTSAHDAGILRYRFSWLAQRRRAVAR